MTIARAAFWLMVVAVVALVILWYRNLMHLTTQIFMPDTSGSASVGAPLVDSPVRDLDGRKTSLRAFIGHPLWINFFATWCAPCKAETPELEREYVRERPSGLTLVGVDEQESSAAVRSFERRFGTTYPMVIDAGPAEVYYHAQVIPLSVFVDASGTIRRIRIGQMQRSDIEDALALIIPKR
jgi:thiol-disulfide isomerase/thioredoxin